MYLYKDSQDVIHMSAHDTLELCIMWPMAKKTKKKTGKIFACMQKLLRDVYHISGA